MPEWAVVALVVLAAVLWMPFWWLMGGLHVLWTQRGMPDEGFDAKENNANL
jgi:hypothetical protein